MKTRITKDIASDLNNLASHMKTQTITKADIINLFEDGKDYTAEEATGMIYAKVFAKSVFSSDKK